MKDFSDALGALRTRVDEARVYLRIDELRADRPQLEIEASRPDLWDDPERAKKVNAELSACTEDIDLFEALSSRIDDAETLFELGREEGDDSVEPEIAGAIDSLADDLAELQREQRESELATIRGEQRSVGFGSQIRSYVLQPYQMVKDLRSGHESGNVDAVLDGDLDGFMESYLRWERSGAESVGE